MFPFLTYHGWQQRLFCPQKIMKEAKQTTTKQPSGAVVSWLLLLHPPEVPDWWLGRLGPSALGKTRSSSPSQHHTQHPDSLSHVAYLPCPRALPSLLWALKDIIKERGRWIGGWGEDLMDAVVVLNMLANYMTFLPFRSRVKFPSSWICDGLSSSHLSNKIG